MHVPGMSFTTPIYKSASVPIRLDWHCSGPGIGFAKFHKSIKAKWKTRGEIYFQLPDLVEIKSFQQFLRFRFHPFSQNFMSNPIRQNNASIRNLKRMPHRCDSEGANTLARGLSGFPTPLNQ